MQFVLFSSLAFAAYVNAEGLLARQVRQVESGGIVSNCPPERLCGTWCLRIGEFCCPELYPCDANTEYCLTQEACCFTGQDPNACARDKRITLPPGFQVGGQVSSSSPPSVPRSSSAAPATSSSIAVVVPSSITTPVVVVPSYTATGNATIPAPTGTGVVTRPSVVPFTGGAERFGAVGKVVAAVAGFVGLLL